MSARQGRRGPEAAVFDLDGVVTFTARVHFAAWKELFDEYLRTRERRSGEPFRPFTEADYVAYVDGRPRHDGVRTFLASRGITLPEGQPSDPPEAATVAGLAARKNALFHARLREMGVDVDAEAVRLVRELRARGIRVGVASSSKNTGLILETAGLEDLFEAQVDGIVSERLGLRGKPAPDIFLECLDVLGVPDPTRALVAEDAVAGVEAGRAAGFGLVLGVDRGGRAVALREHGADWIIRGFGEVSAGRIEAYFENRRHARPNALAHWTALAAELRGRRPAVYLDHEGTSTPIARQPELAVPAEELRAALDRPDVVPLYIGEDEDALRALEGRGIGILVTEVPRPTAARYSLQDVVEVRALLDRLAGLEVGRPS